MISSRVNRAKREAIKRIRKNFSGMTVLDLGCGPGSSASLFENADYTGIDINRKYIKAARRRYPRMTFKVGDAARGWEGHFDIILINSLLHHLDDRSVLRVLVGAASSLNPEGEIILQEPLYPFLDEKLCLLLVWLDQGNHFRTLTRWKRLVSEAGLYPREMFFYSLRLAGLRVYQMVSLNLVLDALLRRD